MNDDYAVMVVQTFSYTVPGIDGKWTWNIDAAEHLVDDGRELFNVDAADIAARYEYDEANVAIADPTIPGIAAPISHPKIDPGLHVLIDGTHRAVRAAREGREFLARVLTEEESRRCLIEEPQR